MKKKLFAILLLSAAATCTAFAFAGCGEAHNFGDWVIEKQPTCTREGQKYHACQDEGCNYLEWEVIPMEPHDYKWYSATTTEHASKCANCGDIKTENHTLNQDNVCTVCELDKNATITLGYTLNEDNQSYTVYGKWNLNLDTLTDLVIPSTHNGLPVTAIADRAFIRYENLKSVSLPDTITDIGNDAFYNCYLTKITLYNNVKSIGDDAFVTDYGYSNEFRFQFYFCGTPNEWENIEKGTGAVTDYHEKIYIVMAYYCEKIQESGLILQLYDNEYRVIGYDGTATQLLIPNSYKDKPITSINYSAFQNCVSLTSITIPDSVTSINAGAFSGCSGLASISVDENNSTYKSENNCILTKDGKALILGCKNSIIPDGVTRIGSSAFEGCSSLTSITIPDSVTSIDSYAFEGCTGIIQAENGVQYVDKWVIGCYNGVTVVTLRSNTKGIAKSAFSSCSNLTSITIPDSVTSICDLAFFNYSGQFHEYDNGLYLGNETNPYIALITTKNKDITSCIINSNTKFIYCRAFEGCSNLTSITIPDIVTSIDSYAFSKCSNLTSITIPNSVTSIDSFAFCKCSNLTSITIPDSVTSINSYAFLDCISLTSINFNGTKEQWNAITKGNFWNDYTGDFIVTCTDGKLDKDGNEITE